MKPSDKIAADFKDTLRNYAIPANVSRDSAVLSVWISSVIEYIDELEERLARLESHQPRRVTEP
jgi:hypothetical protein